MGEITEMIFDGTLCQVCGTFLNEDPPGYPCSCDDCARLQRPSAPKVACPTCGKRVKVVGLADHWRDAHK